MKANDGQKKTKQNLTKNLMRDQIGELRLTYAHTHKHTNTHSNMHAYIHINTHTCKNLTTIIDKYSLKNYFCTPLSNSVNLKY